MSWQYRKSKTFGPLRVTVTKRGISTSVGAGPLRISRGADGKVRRTVRIPGTGLYDTKVVGGGTRRGSVRPVPPPAPPAPTWFPLAPNSTLNNRIRGNRKALHAVHVFFWTCMGLTALLLIIAAVGK